MSICHTNIFYEDNVQTQMFYIGINKLDLVVVKYILVYFV